MADAHPFVVSHPAAPCSSLRAFVPWILARHAALGAVTEIRIIRSTPGGEKGVWSGYFSPSSLDTLLTLLAPCPGGPRSRLPHGAHPRAGEANVYFSLQGVSPVQAARRPPALTRAAATTRDRDILVYTLFVADIDPVRPSNTSATDREKAAALEVATCVRAWLSERALPSLLADSGNGYHVLVPLVSYRDARVAEAADHARTLLKLLDARFSTPEAKVDLSTFNPSRILKLYGTLAVKGESTPERPHRPSSIDLSLVPDDVDLFDRVRDDLEAFRNRPRAGGPREPVPPTTTGADQAATAATSKAARASADSGDDVWQRWRREALEALALEDVYGPLLTGLSSASGWLECRDPRSPTGDQTPSAGVADGTTDAERGTFHTFRTGESMSVFDFLIQQGRATSFRAACALIARLSGVPLPTATLPNPGAKALLERFTARWGTLTSEPSQLAFLQETLVYALQLSPLAREPVLQKIREVTGLSSRVLREVYTDAARQARREAREARLAALPSPPEPGRLVVDYIDNRDSIAQLFDAVLSVILPAQRFFRYQQDLVFVRPGLGPLAVTEANLPGLLSALTEVRFFHEVDAELDFRRFNVLPRELARAFVHDPRVLDQLPELRLYCRSPLFDFDWQFIGTPGFYPNGVFYDGPPVVLLAANSAPTVCPGGALDPLTAHAPDASSAAFPPEIAQAHPRDTSFATVPPEVARAHTQEASLATVPPGAAQADAPLLERGLEGFRWRAPADRVNFIGALLTAITMPNWGRGHPFLAINGNKAGVGKSTLANFLAAIAEGRAPATVSYHPDDAELEKQLATRVEAGDRIIVLDNVKVRKPIDSPILERCVTDPRPNFRRLGSNTAITRPQNDLLFVLTMNMTQLGPDLRRRALPVNLFMEENVRTAHYPLEDVVSFVQAHRLEVIAELGRMVQRWLDAGRPLFPDAAQHSVGHRWGPTIDSILRVNGLEGFLSNFEASLHDFDPSWELVRDIAAAHRDQPAAHAAEWVWRLEQSGHNDRFRDRNGVERTARAKATIVGALFSDYADTIFPVGREHIRLVRTFPDGEDHKPAYRFATLAR